MKLDSGHKVIPVSREENDEQKEMFLAYTDGVIKLEPDNWFFPRAFENYANELYNFKFCPTDVLIMTYPKCGTAWLHDIIWTMRNNPNLDHPTIMGDGIFKKPFLEADFIFTSPHSELFIPEKILMEKTGSADVTRFFINNARATAAPRTIKTHLPFSLLQKNLINVCKVVYLMRDPKDVCVSYHHHSRLLTCHGFTGTLGKFVDLFVSDKLMYSPIWKMYEEAWNKRSHPNLLILFYEKLLSNPKREIGRLNEFLCTNLNEKQIDNVISHTKFSNMKKRDEDEMNSTNDYTNLNRQVLDVDGGMFRKGISGDWKDKLNNTQIQKIDDWVNKHVQSLGADFKVLSTYG